MIDSESLFVLVRLTSKNRSLPQNDLHFISHPCFRFLIPSELRNSRKIPEEIEKWENHKNMTAIISIKLQIIIDKIKKIEIPKDLFPEQVFPGIETLKDAGSFLNISCVL